MDEGRNQGKTMIGQTTQADEEIEKKSKETQEGTEA